MTIYAGTVVCGPFDIRVDLAGSAIKFSRFIDESSVSGDLLATPRLSIVPPP